MKIVVAIKQVPARDSLLRVSTSGRWIEEEDLSWEINEPDAYALEEALQVKEKAGGEVVVVCVGPDRATATIREALAKGADRAIHVVEEEDAGKPDTLTLGRVLAKAIGAEQPDLVLTGLQSDDLGNGQTGVVLAELLGFVHATIIMQVEVTGDGIRVKRELEGGWYQMLEMPLPAVLTIQSGINKLRYATLMGLKKAKSKEIRTLDIADTDVPSESILQVSRVYLPERSKQTHLFDGPAEESAEKLVQKLRLEARAL